jgi:hypothetical protein
MKWAFLILIGLYVYSQLKVTTNNHTFFKLERIVTMTQKEITANIFNADTLFSSIPKIK